MNYEEEALEFLGITKWHKAGYTGKGIKILSDEKVCEKKHPDVISPKGFKSKKSHGDDVMAHLKMVAPDATFVAFPFSGTFGSEYKCDCAEYIKQEGVHIFTTSCVGSYPSQGKQKAIQDCIESGCIFFGCAGNDGDEGIQEEIQYEGYLAIGGVRPKFTGYYKDDEPIYDWDNLQRVSYSSVGEELDYVTLAEMLGASGTSFCSPVFAGMVGLVQQFFIEKIGRELTREEMIRFIDDNLIDTHKEGFDQETGHGLFRLPDPDSIKISDYVTDTNVGNNGCGKDINVPTIDYGGIPKMEYLDNIRLSPMPLAKYDIKCPFEMEPEFIVVHNTANDASAYNEINYMQGNDEKISFHIAVDDEEIIQAIPLNRMAFHAGDGIDGEGNRKGISIEICYSKSGGARFEKAKLKAIDLIVDLLLKYKWDISHVKKHQDFSGKYCPHRILDEGWDKFLNQIQERMEERTMVRYKTVEELPYYYRQDIQELVDKGIIAGRGGEAGLDLSDDMCRMAIYFKKMLEQKEG